LVHVEILTCPVIQFINFFSAVCVFLGIYCIDTTFFLIKAVISPVEKGLVGLYTLNIIILEHQNYHKLKKSVIVRVEFLGDKVLFFAEF
jgi:hypothetical protein